MKINPDDLKQGGGPPPFDQPVEPIGAGRSEPADPMVGLTAALEGLAAVNRWLVGVRADPAGDMAAADTAAADVRVLTAVVEGLGHVDAVATAARIRAIVAAEEAGLAEADGQVSTAAWLTGRLRMTRSGCGREARFAAAIVDHHPTMTALESGQISREHALAMAEARRQQQRDHDHHQAARRDTARREQQARQAQAAKAAAAAASAAQRQALEAAAAEAERRIAARQAQETARRQAEADAAQERRAAELLNRARRGEQPDQTRTHAKRLAAGNTETLARQAAYQYSARSERHWADAATGMGHVHAILTPEDYARYRTAFDAAHTFDSPDTPMAERRTAEQRGADAFMDVINAGLRDGQLPTSQGVKPHVTLTAPIDTVTEQSDAPGMTAYGDLLPAETVRRISCDAGLTRAILSATGRVLDIGRQTSSWTVAQHRAAALTFGGCAFPVAEGQACGRPPAWCELHHIRYWSKGGRTDLDNGALLCTRHHHQVHDNGWTLTYDTHTQTVTVTNAGERGGHLTRSVRFGAWSPHTPGDNDGGPGVTGEMGAQPPSSTAQVRSAPDVEPDRLPL